MPKKFWPDHHGNREHGIKHIAKEIIEILDEALDIVHSRGPIFLLSVNGKSIVLLPYQVNTMPDVTANTGQLVTFTIEQLDTSSPPVPMDPPVIPDSPPTWGNANPTLGTLTPAADGLSATYLANAPVTDQVSAELIFKGVSFRAEVNVIVGGGVVVPTQTLGSIALKATLA